MLFDRITGIGPVDQVYLITEDILDGLPRGTVLSSITGEHVVVGKDRIDRDTRFGKIAFGFIVERSQSNDR